MLTETFMTVTEFTAFGPPRPAMLQITRLVLIHPGTGGLHVTGLPLGMAKIYAKRFNPSVIDEPKKEGPISGPNFL